MANFRAGLNWSRSPMQMGRDLTVARQAFTVAVRDFAMLLAQKAEREAKANAPWRDRTGAARAGLRGWVEGNGGAYRVILAHGVPYGIWLEVKHAGRWGIVLKTLEAQAPEWRRFLAWLGF